MKRLFIILLLSTFLVSATDLKELLKLNIVVEHYHEHCAADRSLSLIDFFVMHYLTDDKNDKDNERDNKLPFKSTNYSISSRIGVVTPIRLAELIDLPQLKKEHPFSNENDLFSSNKYCTCVWNPPQFA